MLDALARDGFIGPRKPQVPVWKRMFSRDNSDEDEEMDDDFEQSSVSTAVPKEFRGIKSGTRAMCARKMDMSAYLRPFDESSQMDSEKW